MNPPFRYVPPAGSPIRPGDLVAWTKQLFSNRDARADLCAALQTQLGVRHCHLISTGRAALTVILKSMRRLSPQRDVVIVPSYTCFSVPASVIKAGLTPRIVDVDPATLDYDWFQLDLAIDRRVLAVIATNLYGLPSDLPRLSLLVREAGVFLIDDAAQALGGAVGGRPCGTWGEAGLYSFDKGKNVSAIEGGVIVTGSEELNVAIDAELESVRRSATTRVAGSLIKLAAYVAFMPPSRYWIPNGIPQLRLGTTPFDVTFSLEAYSRTLAALALTMLDRLGEFTAHRRRAAGILTARLEQFPELTLPRPGERAEPVYLRFPVLLADGEARRQALKALNAAGIGATGSYPTSIADIPALRGVTADARAPLTGGRSVASTILTLPTHPHVSDVDLERIADILERVARSTPGVRLCGAVVH